jgi:hydroxyacylglutathione hydrolase
MSLNFIIIPVTAFQQNCTLLFSETDRKTAIIDPGGDIDLIIQQIETHKLIPEKIWLTHGHIDHVGGATALSNQLNLPIEGPHIDDDFWLQGLTEQAEAFGFRPCPSLTPDRWLNDGDTLTLAGESIRVIHTPGHTPGHVIFFIESIRLALVGDVLFNGSIGRTDFPKGNYATLIDSITQKLWPLGEDIRFIPGHGPMSDFGYEMKHNPFVKSS